MLGQSVVSAGVLNKQGARVMTENSACADVQSVVLDKVGTGPEKARIFLAGVTGLFHDHSKG